VIHGRRKTEENLTQRRKGEREKLMVRRDVWMVKNSEAAA